jgi:hypothetical protein
MNDHDPKTAAPEPPDGERACPPSDPPPEGGLTLCSHCGTPSHCAACGAPFNRSET